MDNPEFEKLLVTITCDINKTLKTNLGSYFKTIDNNKNIINILKSLLFNMPEYIELKNKYELLENNYNALKIEYNNYKLSKCLLTFDINNLFFLSFSPIFAEFLPISHTKIIGRSLNLSSLYI